MTPEQRLALLVCEVERYLDNPGCNLPAQQNAQRRLRWAWEQAIASNETQPETHPATNGRFPS